MCVVEVNVRADHLHVDRVRVTAGVGETAPQFGQDRAELGGVLDGRGADHRRHPGRCDTAAMKLNTAIGSRVL